MFSANSCIFSVTNHVRESLPLFVGLEEWGAEVHVLAQAPTKRLMGVAPRFVQV